MEGFHRVEKKHPHKSSKEAPKMSPAPYESPGAAKGADFDYINQGFPQTEGLPQSKIDRIKHIIKTNEATVRELRKAGSRNETIINSYLAQNEVWKGELQREVDKELEPKIVLVDYGHPPGLNS